MRPGQADRLASVTGVSLKPAVFTVPRSVSGGRVTAVLGGESHA